MLKATISQGTSLQIQDQLLELKPQFEIIQVYRGEIFLFHMNHYYRNRCMLDTVFRNRLKYFSVSGEEEICIPGSCGSWNTCFEQKKSHFYASD